MNSALRAHLKLLILPVLLVSVLARCGGGTDVGNPDIRGVVSYQNGLRAGGAMVILGRPNDLGALDTSYAESIGTLLICFKTRGFDTTYCNSNGEFTFSEMVPGRYLAVASKGTLLGMETIEHYGYESSEIALTIDQPAYLTIETRGSAQAFFAARIAGTTIMQAPDPSGKIMFGAVPSGDLDIIFYKSDSSVLVYSDFASYPACSASLVVDPLREPEFWQPVSCGPRPWDGLPYVLSSLPVDGASGESARVNYGKPFDIKIRFSHPMDAWILRSALSVLSTDSSATIDSVWFEGSSVVNVSLCIPDSSGLCVRRDSMFASGVTYSIIVDTSAISAAGVGFAFPETLSFTPEPLP